MKWIGQHIYNLISRFRQKVFIESGDLEISKVSGDSTLELSSWSAGAGDSGVLKFQKSGTAAVDTFTAGDHTTAGEQLGLIEAYGVDDADGSTLSSYIGFYNDAISDADSSPGKIVFATSDANDAGEPTVRLTIDDGGTATFTGNVSLGSGLTFDSVNLSALQTSAESFVDNDTSIMTSGAVADKIEAYGYSTTTGDITGMRLTADDSNVITDTTGSIDFTVAGGEGIDTSVSSTTLTITGEDASATNKGVVELATTSEADTGTDTARAITAAGLKSHVDARYHYQYINFLGNATVPSDGDWMTVSGNGISNHSWNTNLGSGNTTVDSSTATIPVAAIGAGIRIPYAAVLVGFTGIFLRASNHQPAAGLLLGEPTWNDYATFDCTLRAYAAADYSAGPDSNYSSRPIKAEDLSRSQAITAGQVIYPVIKDLGSSASVCKISMTIVIKTLIP